MGSLLIFLICLASVQAIRLPAKQELDEKWICDTEDKTLCYDEDGNQFDEGADAVAQQMFVDMMKTVEDRRYHRRHIIRPSNHSIEFGKRSIARPSAKCPKVYIYDLPPPFQDQPDLMDKEACFGYVVDNKDTGLTKATAETQQGDFRHTNQYALGRIMAHELMVSSCSTKDPAEADLFMIPLLALAKTASKMESACSKINGKDQELLKHLPHLNEHNARRHFIVMGKSWYHIKCDGIYGHPKGLFAHMARVDIEPVVAGNFFEQIKEDGYSPKQQMGKPKDLPRHYVMPRPSDFHGEDFHWEPTGPRQYLLSFVGSASHGDTPVRKKISGSVCTTPLAKCTMFAVHGDKRIDGHTIKSQSTFCMEPIGDSLGRKSISDSYANGCIPVFFGKGTPLSYDYLFSGWENDAYVLIDRVKFLKGEVDVTKHLESIPKERIVQMQAAIKTNGHKLLYRFKASEDKDDAVTMLLKKLVFDAAE